MIILANDGISPEGKEKLTQAGFDVETDNINQEELIDYINSKAIVGLLVRSATTVRKDLIDACPSLKFIGRGGVGMDNIDVEYAREKGLTVQNTPAASSQSVAELVMGALFSISRSTHQSYLEMPTIGDSEFKSLKKKYAKGAELRGKTLAILGFGRIGRSLASYALGAGMRVVAYDRGTEVVDIPLFIEGHGEINIPIRPTNSLEDVISVADYISLHVPKQENGASLLDASAIEKMKNGVRIVNAARGGTIDEDALIAGLNSGKIASCALDVYENEPTPRKDLLTHEKIAATPHIGAATAEAQARIGIELADHIIHSLKVNA